MFFRRRTEPNEPTALEPPMSPEGIDAAGRYAIYSAAFSPSQLAEYSSLGADVVLATLAYHDGQSTVAHALFEAVLARNPKARYLLRDVARARFLVGRHHAAVQAFGAYFAATEGSRTPDETLEASSELALVHDELGDVAAAIDALSVPLDDDDERPEPFLALGRYLRQRGMVEEARDVLGPALPLEACCSGGSCGKRSDVQLELGLCRALLGDARGALELLEPLVSRAPRLSPELGDLLARSYESVGRTSDAARALARVVRT